MSFQLGGVAFTITVAIHCFIVYLV